MNPRFLKLILTPFLPGVAFFDGSSIENIATELESFMSPPIFVRKLAYAMVVLPAESLPLMLYETNVPYTCWGMVAVQMESPSIRLIGSLLLVVLPLYVKLHSRTGGTILSAVRVATLASTR